MALTAPPPRLRRALDSWAAWQERGLFWVPVRHHSPACALALGALLDEVRPEVVLIEGPREYTALVGALQHPDTRPPVALLTATDSMAALYPLAEFSPEWVALRWAGEHGADVRFIDASYTAEERPQLALGALPTPLAEHHLARSRALASLADKLGCRDHDEVWEHLFECRGAEVADWRGLFGDVFAWAALARLEASREDLAADGTLAREAVMADEVAAVAGRRAVVVTGAFHTLALLEVLDGTPEGAWVRAAASDRGVPDEPGWLIRYDFRRLDGLLGYGAGMPAPGFWQRSWEARRRGVSASDFVTDTVLTVAAGWRERGEPLGTAQVIVAVEQILGLARLRGRAWPGRTDVLDGLLSTLAKDAHGLVGALGEAVADVFAPSSLGSVPAGVASPPLVAQARDEAKRLRFAVDDARPRQVSLDPVRQPRQRARREFLARMRFIGSGFARQIGGADLVTGINLGQFLEQWEYAWTPTVETALIEASAWGPTLDSLIAFRLAQRLDPEASLVALGELVAELLVMGCGDRIAAVTPLLEARLTDEGSFAAAVAALVPLVGTLDADGDGGRIVLGESRGLIERVVRRGLVTAASLMADLTGVAPDAAEEAASALVTLHGLVGRGALAGEVFASEVAAVRRAFTGLRLDPRTPSLPVGCLVGLAIAGGEITEEAASEVLAARLSVGADPAPLAGFLLGLMQAAPDVVVRRPGVIEALTDALAGLDEGSFLAVLPDLRRAFTYLKPAETHQVAEQVARLTGVRAEALDVVWQVDPELADRALCAERLLVEGLNRDGLTAWVQGEVPA